MAPLLEIENLRVELATRDGRAPVIDDLSFSINEGETVSFVGESGCGKSMTALAIMGLLPAGVGHVNGLTRTSKSAWTWSRSSSRASTRRWSPTSSAPSVATSASSAPR